MMFSCRGSCKRTDLTIDQMKKERYLMSNFRGICKPCHTEYNVINLHMKRAEKNPENYMMCNGCDRVFSKYKAGAPDKNGLQKLCLDCPHCKSKDIEAY